LGVQYIVEGSVRKGGDRLRITAQLIDAMTGNHLWGERYDRALKDVFAVQDEVVHTIVGTLEGRLATRIAEQARGRPTQSLAAYECVLQARQHMMTFERISCRTAADASDRTRSRLRACLCVAGNYSLGELFLRS
jgi:adenylate cyclase